MANNLALKLKQIFLNASLDNTGWFRGGQFTPKQQIQDIGNQINTNVVKAGGWGNVVYQASPFNFVNANTQNAQKNLVTPLFGQRAGQNFSDVTQALYSPTPISSQAKNIANLIRPNTFNDTYKPYNPNLYRLTSAAANTAALTPAFGGIPAAATAFGGNVVGGATINTGIKIGSNVISGQKWNQDLLQAAEEGGIFGAELTPITKITGLALNPSLNRILMGTNTKLSTYITLAQNAADKSIKSKILWLAAKRFGQNVTKDAILGAVGMGTYGATMPAANSQERWQNVKSNAIMGAAMNAGIKTLGSLSDIVGNNVLKPQLEARAKLTNQQRLKQQGGYANLSPQDIEKATNKAGSFDEFKNKEYLRKLNPKGLIEETSVQTAFRRSQGIKPEDVYRNQAADQARLQAEIESRLNRLKPNEKVNILDYYRTPDRVFAKLGLKNESSLLRTGYEKYKSDIKIELNKVTEWSKQANTPGASERIFRALDGEPIKLEPTELKVAREIKEYLKVWADKLDLPYESRITKYIPHIFEQGEIAQEFDPAIAKMIDAKVAGSIYDPFLQKRLGTEGYVADAWRALDAYIKRATRKVNLDPALEKIRTASNTLDLESTKYLEKYISKVNMRPTERETLIDNWLKSTKLVGYKYGDRPITVLTGRLRQTISRALLGLNPGSAVRNLSQGSNTYAVLGEKYTIKGYYDLVKNGTDDLYKAGVLDDSIADRNISAIASRWQKLDSVLYKLFDWTEKINRGSAFYGAKAKGLSQGMTEQVAIDYGKQVVRDTQFTFGNIDTPVGINDDIMKVVTQFLTYGLKQTEFLGEKIAKKDIVGLTRFVASQLLYIGTIGKLIGMDWKDMIPITRFKPPALQLGENVKNLISPGEDTGRKDALIDTATMIIPAGSQIKKTIEGLGTVNRGYSQTPSGNVRFPVQQTPGNYTRGTLFGQWNLPEAQQYLDNNTKSLGENQTKYFKASADQMKAYQDIIATRNTTAQEKKVETLVEETGTSTYFGDKYFYLENGSVKSLDTTFEAKSPTLTGQMELDKKLLSSYKSDLTKQANIAVDMYSLGLITKEEAEKKLNTITTKRAKVASPKKAKKPKKIAVKKISYKPIKISTQKGVGPKKLYVKIAKRPNLKISKPGNLINLINR